MTSTTAPRDFRVADLSLAPFGPRRRNSLMMTLGVGSGPV